MMNIYELRNGEGSGKEIIVAKNELQAWRKWVKLLRENGAQFLISRRSSCSIEYLGEAHNA